MVETKISILNPIRLLREEFTPPLLVNARHAEYFQKFQKLDKTAIQLAFGANPTTFAAKLVNQKTLQETAQTATEFTFPLNSGIWFGQVALNFSTIPVGQYKLIITVDEQKFISDTLCIQDTHEDTYFFSYSNTENVQGVVFTEGLFFGLRVEADMTYNALTPNSENTIYESDFGEFTQVFSSPFDTFNLNIGGQVGIPDWLISIVNRMFSCDRIFLKGGQITKIESSEWSPAGEDNHSLRSWGIQISRTGDQFAYRDGLLTIEGVTNYTPPLFAFAHTYQLKIYGESGYNSVVSSVGWASLTPTTGAAGFTMATLSVSENTTESTRTGTITVKDSFGNEAKVLLSQPPSFLTVDGDNPFQTTIPSTGGLKTFSVKSSSAWYIYGSIPSEITIHTQQGGAGTSQLIITFPQNTGLQRTFSFTLQNDQWSCGVKFTQTARYMYWESINHPLLHMGISGSGGVRTDVLRSSSNWVLQSHNYNWITVNPTQGGDNTAVTITIAPSGSTEIRMAILTFQNPEGLNAKIYISQGGGGDKIISNTGENIIDKYGNNLTGQT